MSNAPSINWTNSSVRAFAKNTDPLATIEEAARALVLKAREKAWEGPPFNPLRIAEMLEVQIEANSSVADARLVATESGPKIEFNPQQPRERVRFSIAHEIAHLLYGPGMQCVKRGIQWAFAVSSLLSIFPAHHGPGMRRSPSSVVTQ